MMMQDEAVEEEERELTPDEIGRKIASQWTTDPDAAGSSLEAGTAQEEEGKEGSQGSESAAEDSKVVTELLLPMCLQ